LLALTLGPTCRALRYFERDNL